MEKKEEMPEINLSVIKSIVNEAMIQLELGNARLAYKIEAGVAKICIDYCAGKNNSLAEFYNSECFLSIKDKWIKRSSVFDLYYDYADNQTLGRAQFWNAFRRDNNFQAREIHGTRQIYIKSQS